MAFNLHIFLTKLRKDLFAGRLAPARVHPAFKVYFLIVTLFLGLDPSPGYSQSTKAEEKTLLFLGDSLTEGYGIDERQAFPALIQERCRAAGLPFRIINGGVSGDTSAGGLRRLDWLMRQRVDVLFLALGANDGLRGFAVESTKSNLSQIIEKARSKDPNIRILLAGMLVPPSMGQSYQVQFKSIFPEIAKQYSVPLMPFLLEGVAGEASLNLKDGIHPNVEGHKRVANEVWKYLEPILRGVSPSSALAGL